MQELLFYQYLLEQEECLHVSAVICRALPAVNHLQQHSQKDTEEGKSVRNLSLKNV